jgi:two-component system NtrC family sensor kinase
VARAVGVPSATAPAAQAFDKAMVEQRTRALTSALVAGLPTAVWCFDLLGHLEIANHTANRLSPTLIGYDDMGFVHTVGGRLFAELMGSREPMSWESQSSDGVTNYELHSHVATIEGTARLSVTATDVTRERAMLARLADAERRAAVGVLGAGVAHEINNPLGFVTANVRSLGEYTTELAALVGDRAEVTDILKDLPNLLDETNRGLQRISTIVRELLHFSARGAAEEPSVTLSLAEVVDQALRLAGHELRKRTRVDRVDKASPKIQGHMRQLGDVVLDLLVNAADAVEKMPQERRVISVRTYGAGRLAVLEVEDTGIGIAPHVVPRVFDPFFTTKGPRRGSGLGLSVASEVVRRHGGEIVLTSREGVGTVVRVEIPATS